MWHLPTHTFMVQFNIQVQLLHSEDRRIFRVRASSENTLDNLRVLLRHGVCLPDHVRFNVWLYSESNLPTTLLPVQFPQHYLSLFQHNSTQFHTYLQQRLQDPDLVEYSRIHVPYFKGEIPPEDPVHMLLGIEIVPDHPQIGVSTAALTYQYDDESDTDTDDEVQFQ